MSSYLVAPLSTRIPQFHPDMSPETRDYISGMDHIAQKYKARVDDLRVTANAKTATLVAYYNIDRKEADTSHLSEYNSFTGFPIFQEECISRFTISERERFLEYTHRSHEIQSKFYEDEIEATKAYNSAKTELVETFYAHVAEERLRRKARKANAKAIRDFADAQNVVQFAPNPSEVENTFSNWGFVGMMPEYDEEDDISNISDDLYEWFSCASFLSDEESYDPSDEESCDEGSYDPSDEESYDEGSYDPSDEESCDPANDYPSDGPDSDLGY